LPHAARSSFISRNEPPPPRSSTVGVQAEAFDVIIASARRVDRS
jgi:hypothetical protein